MRDFYERNTNQRAAVVFGIIAALIVCWGLA